jgi:hypothetical protein
VAAPRTGKRPHRAAVRAARPVLYFPGSGCARARLSARANASRAWRSTSSRRAPSSLLTSSCSQPSLPSTAGAIGVAGDAVFVAAHCSAPSWQSAQAGQGDRLSVLSVSFMVLASRLPAWCAGLSVPVRTARPCGSAPSPTRSSWPAGLMHDAVVPVRERRPRVRVREFRVAHKSAARSCADPCESPVSSACARFGLCDARPYPFP